MAEFKHTLSECLKILGWTEAQLAREIGAHKGTPLRWVGGELTTPESLLVWLNKLAAYRLKNPVPDWRAVDRSTFKRKGEAA